MLSRTDLCLLQSVVAQPHHSPHQVQLGHGDHQLAGQSRLQPGDGTGPEKDSRPDRESKQDRTVEVRGPLVNLVSTPAVEKERNKESFFLTQKIYSI